MISYNSHLPVCGPVVFCVNEVWYEVGRDLLRECARIVGENKGDIVALMRQHGLPEATIDGIVCFARKGGKPRLRT